LLGVALALVWLLMIFKDARALSRNNDLSGTFALGWAGVAIVMIFAMPYKNIILFNVLGYLFWYFSGYIAAERVREVKRENAAAAGSKFDVNESSTERHDDVHSYGNIGLRRADT
jgi:hypothetical protein